MQDDPKIVRALLEAGADPDQRDSVGRSAAKVADEHYKKEALKELKNWEEKKSGDRKR